jgi:curved DNA-binding protein CbpA
MELKDYYEILELPPSASHDEIRRSYRRMAQVYHPDKNEGDPYAAARFAMVKEAYEVLTDPAKKSLYLQERWLAKSNGRVQKTAPLTPESVLKRIIEKERSVARMDSSRLNSEGLHEELTTLFSSEVIDMLNKFDDEGINSEIVRLASHSARWLTPDQQQKFYQHLGAIKTDQQQQKALQRGMKQSMKNKRWDRIQIWLLLVIVTAICLLIFMVGQ